MTKLGMRLRDVPHSLGWDGLLVFLTNLPQDSAYARSLFPEYSAFASPLKHASMMADIIDCLLWFRYEFATAFSDQNHQPDPPKPYETPWNKYATPEDPFNGAYGKGAISSLDFDDWYYGGS